MYSLSRKKAHRASVKVQLVQAKKNFWWIHGPKDESANGASTSTRHPHSYSCCSSSIASVELESSIFY